jgi:NAD(P)-dependent dehydrogenase (short-subunit alcohol dehydrogenase family)
MADLSETVAFITGGQRGLGQAFARELLSRGARKVYVTARNPVATLDARVVPLAVDVTNPTTITAAAAQAADVNLVINNAGAASAGPLLANATDTTRAVFETNFFGPLEVAKAFAPILAAHGGGTLVNIHSVLSWLGGAGAYGASKAAIWSLTNSLRKELRDQGTLVIGVHLGFADTDMTRQLDVPKIAPEVVAQCVVDGILAGEREILVDDVSRQVKALLSGPVDALVY